jgi:hypothetical protein
VIGPLIGEDRTAANEWRCQIVGLGLFSRTAGNKYCESII